MEDTKQQVTDLLAEARKDLNYFEELGSCPLNSQFSYGRLEALRQVLELLED